MIHVTAFRKNGKHSTGPSTYGPWVRTYSKWISLKSVLTVCSYKAQSNEICTYRRVSRGSLPRVRRYDLLYLRTVEYDKYIINEPSADICRIIAHSKRGETSPRQYLTLLLFEIKLAAIISSIHPHCLVKTANSETPNTGTSKGQRDKIYIAVVLCHTDLSYGPDTSYNTDIYIILISHAFVIMIHHPGVISHHADIITCWYVVWYHMLQYWYVNC